MLVLTRKSEEQIVIGDEDKIIITILRIDRDKVSIGIQANRKKFPIFRGELLDEKEGQPLTQEVTKFQIQLDANNILENHSNESLNTPTSL